MDFELAVMALSSLAAIAAALYAKRNNELYLRSTELAEEESRRKRLSLKAYLIDGATWLSESSGRKCAFAVTLTNTAETPMAVVKAELHLDVFGEDGEVHQIILMPDAKSNAPNREMRLLDCPINLNARSAVSGWLMYQVNARVDCVMRIDRYRVVFTVDSGERTEVCMYILQRINNEESDNP